MPFSCLTGLTGFALVVMVIANASSVVGEQSKWVQRGVTGRLIYVPDAQGDRVPDFSDVGYRAGRATIPVVSAAILVDPRPGDDTESIQAAIDHVATLPLDADGFRGAVLLAPGDYELSGQLTIGVSGVVLRGSGRDVDGTVLRATGTSQRDLIKVLGQGSATLTGSTRQMVDKTVPVGARSFRVDSTSGFAVGDQVRISRPSPANWINELGMDRIPPRSDGQSVTQWQAGAFDLRIDRVITRIEGVRVFVDAPLTNSFELQYGGGQIKKYNWSGRIENVGVESLRAESDYTFETDEDHAWNFVTIDKAQNVWVRETTSAHFARSAVLSHPGAKWVTVEDAVNLSPVSRVTGGRRYTFDLSGQLELVTDSEANEGRHDFVNNSTRPVGPHVFHNSVANNALDESGPHQRWATGTLFDGLTIDGDQINIRNRGNYGTGHGWAGANMVVWNSTANSFIVQNPPTAQNWLIGSTGTIIDDQTFGPQPAGYVDLHGAPVDIDSLYEAQVADAANVTKFHWSGDTANWNDADAWQENLTPGGYRIEARDYLIGDIDNFTHDGPGSVDEAYTDPVWRALVQGLSGQPVTGFDDMTSGQSIAFSVEHRLDPGERVVHGTLAFSLSRTDGTAGEGYLRLFDDDAQHRLSFSTLGWDTGLARAEPHVGVVDLGAFTDELQTGAVNVQLYGDAAADWALYSVVVASPLIAPPPAEVFVDGGGLAVVDSAISGVGRLTVGANSAGALSLRSTGSITLQGDYTQASNGVLQIELGDAEHGAVFAEGDTHLNGQLSIVLATGFEPTIGQVFNLITGGGRTGVFSAFTAPELAIGLAWRTTYGDESVLLTVVLSGDYNRDGFVDAADYTVWRDSLGETSNLVADGDNNGLIDNADLEVWRSSFGLSAADFPAAVNLDSTVAPEPSSVAISLVVAAFVRCRPTRG